MTADTVAEMHRARPVIDVHDAFCLHPLPGGGAVAALRGLSLTVPAGERLVLHGPNGSGKTTLLKVLAGEQSLAAGRAVVAGVDMSATSAAALARWRGTKLGQVDQDPWRLLRPEFDVLTNVALQLRLNGATKAASLRTAAEALESLGLEQLGPRNPVTLSGGERQRVAVCAALAHRPALVLADEPTGELDADSARAVYDLLDVAVRAAGATLVLVSHDPMAWSVADRVLRIRDGRISESRRPNTSAGDADPSSLVVDDRGWVWLPPEARSRMGGTGEVRVELIDGTVAPAGVILHGTASAGHTRSDEHTSSDGYPSSYGRSDVPVRLGVTADVPVRLGVTADVPGDAPLARLEGVVVEYGGRRIVSPTDLEVVPGRMLALTGRSGSGKSTLLRVLLGLYRPAAGTAYLGGRDLADCDRDELAAIRAGLCGVVSQRVYLAENADPAGNLDLARAARGLPADDGSRWLERLGLGGFGGRPVVGLSGGERQRLALAKVLCLGPPLLVLDEPTSHLDEAGAMAVAELLTEVARAGTAVLVATHEPALVAAADDEHALSGNVSPALGHA